MESALTHFPRDIASEGLTSTTDWGLDGDSVALSSEFPASISLLLLVPSCLATEGLLFSSLATRTVLLRSLLGEYPGDVTVAPTFLIMGEALANGEPPGILCLPGVLAVFILGVVVVCCCGVRSDFRAKRSGVAGFFDGVPTLSRVVSKV